MSEGEPEMQKPEQSDAQAAEITQAIQPRKRRLTSKYCKDLISVGVESDGKERGQCNHCGKKLVINTKTYDHKVDSEMTSEITIHHNLPFKYDEYEKDCQPICRQTDVVDMF